MRLFAFVMLLVVGLSAGISGLPAQDADSKMPAGTVSQPMRVVSYNIKHGLGNDGRLDLNRTAEVLKRLRPDVVGLQEVDERTRRCGGVDQPSELGKQLQMHHAFGSFMDYSGGRYGLAILSRYPIVKSTVVKLPEGNEPRVALVAEIELPGGQHVAVVNLHFDWVRDDQFRFAQAKKLQQHLTRMEIPYLLLGDFNDVPESRTLKLLGDGRREADKPDDDRFTITATEPTEEIDFIYMAPPDRWAVKGVDVIDEPLASDHRPVLAELLLREANDSPAGEDHGS